MYILILCIYVLSILILSNVICVYIYIMYIIYIYIYIYTYIYIRNIHIYVIYIYIYIYIFIYIYIYIINICIYIIYIIDIYYICGTRWSCKAFSKVFWKSNEKETQKNVIIKLKSSEINIGKSTSLKMVIVKNYDALNWFKTSLLMVIF